MVVRFYTIFALKSLYFWWIGKSKQQQRRHIDDVSVSVLIRAKTRNKQPLTSFYYYILFISFGRGEYGVNEVWQVINLNFSKKKK